MYTLGISCYYHDSAAALLKDGHVIAAVEEERFSRKKFDDDFPKQAIEYCLREGEINKEIHTFNSFQVGYYVLALLLFLIFAASGYGLAVTLVFLFFRHFWFFTSARFYMHWQNLVGFGIDKKFHC